MVVTTLVGGLGNQLFQYAAGRALADRTGSSLRLDVGWLKRSSAGITPRRYELEPFRIRGEIVEVYGRSRTIRLKELLGLAPRPWRETDLRFDDRVVGLTRDVRLIGYWLSERYFADQEDRIRSDLHFRDAPVGRNAEVASLIAETTAVSVHVRRGDYVTDEKVTRRHGLLPLDYYRESVARILRAVPSAHCFVFSDDLGWCREHLVLDVPTTFVGGNDGRPVEDLRLMSLCDHHVIANSSFGWWGAWLDPRKTKIVVAPRQWLTVNQPDVVDLIPPTWIRS